MNSPVVVPISSAKKYLIVHVKKLQWYFWKHVYKNIIKEKTIKKNSLENINTTLKFF